MSEGAPLAPETNPAGLPLSVLLGTFPTWEKYPAGGPGGYSTSR